MMELPFFISMIFLIALNVFYFFLGIGLNCLVIVSFWRSVQLRKKLCHFMIIVLSCCDILVVFTGHLYTAVITMLLLSGNLDIHVYPNWVDVVLELTSMVNGVSFLALLVMNLNMYLATYHPIYHRTSVTKGKLLTILTIMIMF